MAVKAVFFLLVSLLFLATRVSSNVEEYASSDIALPPGPALAPRLAPAPPRIPYMPPVSIAACPKLCGGRCKLHSRPRHCSRVCITCCQRCKCVPPGTYGNREMCGVCYTRMTTHGGRPKCP